MQITDGQTLRLWAGRAPHAKGDADTDTPTITLHLPPDDVRTGGAIVVCPGGAYGFLAEHEGPVIGQWLAAMGVFAAVLKYRLGPTYHHPAMLSDVSRAIRTVRANAEQWRVDPRRVGVLGFSAGGHLAATVSTQFDAGDAAATDAVERQSSRPDVSVLLYPVITMFEYTHTGSRGNLLGPNPPREVVEQMSAERRVTDRTPPTFLFHAVDDAAVPVENAMLYADALRRAKVPFEMHLYETGGHGMGLAQNDPVVRSWGPLLRTWLSTRRIARPL